MGWMKNVFSGAAGMGKYIGVFQGIVVCLFALLVFFFAYRDLQQDPTTHRQVPMKPSVRYALIAVGFVMLAFGLGTMYLSWNYKGFAAFETAQFMTQNLLGNR